MGVDDTPTVTTTGGTTSKRKTPYDIGGQPSYGFETTPDYNPGWAPGLPHGFVGPPLPGTEEVALYERFDWGSAKSFDAKEYSNPPFVGLGSSSRPGAVPRWLQNADGSPKRILRGYMRRSWAHPLTQPNLTEEQKATNARLYFMYNPSEIPRHYVSYQQLAKQAQNGIDDPLNNGQSIPAFVYMNLELLFDRQEEVARFPNHPGVLVDLAVFDLLIGNIITSYDDIMANTRTADMGDEDDTTAVPNSGAPIGSDKTLKPSLDVYVTIVLSPSITFEGRIFEASALFQKFSNRMTPTRMSVSLGLQLNYTGRLLPQGELNASVQAAAAAAKAARDADTGPHVYGLTPLQAATDSAAYQENYNRRVRAVQWGEHWVKDGPRPVLYDVNKRCLNYAGDSETEFDGEHRPGGFDCSSFCFRCYHVVGWGQGLHLGDDCNIVSDDFISKAYTNQDVWVYHEFGVNPRANVEAQAKVLCDRFNHFDTKNNQNEPNTGDLIVRKGVGSAGHIAMIHSNVSKGDDPTAWRWKIIHSGTPGVAVLTPTYTTKQIIFGSGTDMKPYTHLLRPKAIKSVDADNPSIPIGQQTGGSW